jgi:PAS domain S-box-containing protein
MQAATTDRFRLPGWVRVTALVLGIGSCLTLVAGLSWMARQEVDGLSTANSDNVQWGLAQAQVELLQFQLALEVAQDDPARVIDVKRRFDVFYSRVSTLDRGEVHRSLRQNPEFEALQRRVASFLDESAPLIDGPDPALLAALPQLGDQARAIAEDVRALSLSGLGIFADASDKQREKLALTLALLASFLAVLFAGLVLLAVSLARVARVADARAREVQDTAARLRTIVETSLDAIMMIDRTGAIREFNPAAERIFGYGLDEAQGRNAIDLLLPAEESAPLRDGRLRLFDESGRLPPSDRQFELTAVDRAGRRFPAEFSVGSADIDGDRVFVAFVRDISRRRAAEDGLTRPRPCRRTHQGRIRRGDEPRDAHPAQRPAGIHPAPARRGPEPDAERPSRPYGVLRAAAPGPRERCAGPRQVRGRQDEDRAAALLDHATARRSSGGDLGLGRRQ